MVKLASTSTVTGCGHNACGCAGETAPLPGDEVARINGMALHGPGLRPAPAQLLELAHTELLRQEAVGAGLLPECGGSVAPTLHPDEQLVIERMLDAVVATAVFASMARPWPCISSCGSSSTAPSLPGSKSTTHATGAGAAIPSTLRW